MDTGDDIGDKLAENLKWLEVEWDKGFSLDPALNESNNLAASCLLASELDKYIMDLEKSMSRLVDLR